MHATRPARLRPRSVARAAVLGALAAATVLLVAGCARSTGDVAVPDRSTGVSAPGVPTGAPTAGGEIPGPGATRTTGHSPTARSIVTVPPLPSAGPRGASAGTGASTIDAGPTSTAPQPGGAPDQDSLQNPSGGTGPTAGGGTALDGGADGPAARQPTADGSAPATSTTGGTTTTGTSAGVHHSAGVGTKLGRAGTGTTATRTTRTATAGATEAGGTEAGGTEAGTTATGATGRTARTGRTSTPGRPGTAPTTTAKPGPPASPATSATSSSTAPATRTPTSHPAPPPPPIPARYRHVMGWTGSGKVVSLTFDDGPGPYTGQILDILEEKKVPATFCQIGEQVGSYPKIEKRIVADGFVLCNHSWDHDEDLSQRSAAVIDREMSRTQQAITSVAGVRPVYYRAPGADFGDPVKRAAARNHLPLLAWAVDPRDWTRPGANAIVDAVLDQVTPGSIVLLHDGGGDRDETVAALPRIIDGLLARGYSFTTPPPHPAT